MKTHAWLLLLVLVAGSAQTRSAMKSGSAVTTTRSNGMAPRGSARRPLDSRTIMPGPGRWRRWSIAWNNGPAAFQFNLTWSEAHSGLDNWQNEIWFTDDADRLNGAPAAAFIDDDCGDFGFGDGNSEIEEIDIVFRLRCRLGERMRGRLSETDSLVLRHQSQRDTGYGGTGGRFAPPRCTSWGTRSASITKTTNRTSWARDGPTSMPMAGRRPRIQAKTRRTGRCGTIGPASCPSRTSPWFTGDGAAQPGVYSQHPGRASSRRTGRARQLSCGCRAADSRGVHIREQRIDCAGAGAVWFYLSRDRLISFGDSLAGQATPHVGAQRGLHAISDH